MDIAARGDGCGMNGLRALAVIAAIVLSVCPVRAAELSEGVIERVTGDVEILKRGATVWARAEAGTRVGPGDQISTGIDGRATLAIQDSRTDVMSLTQFVVGRSIQSQDQAYTELFLRLGKVVSKVDHTSSRRSRFNVITPAAVVGVRGTRQAVGHFPGIGTEANIRNGKGFAAPAAAISMPDAVLQSALGLKPSSLSGDNAGKDEKGSKEGAKKKKKKEKGKISDEGEETDKEKADGADAGAAVGADAADAFGDVSPSTTGDAVDAFNNWLTGMDQMLGQQDASFQDFGLLDDRTLDFVQPVDDGLRIVVGVSGDPGSFVSTAVTQQMDAQSDIAPIGISPQEREEIATSIEAVVAPVSVSLIEEQSSFTQVNVNAVSESTSSGGIPPSSALVPPALPDRTGKSNVNN